jgi:hypothetical protein
MTMKPVALVAVAFVAACGGSAGSSDSGIRGHAVIGICAAEQEGMDCTAPFRGSFQIRRSGELVRTVQTGNGGRFRARLNPGRYVLQSEGALPYLAPIVVVVREHAFTSVQLGFDSGIR